MNDFLGQALTIDDYVSGCYSENDTPAVFQVYGFTAKKVRLTKLENSKTTILKFPHDLIKLDPIAVNRMVNVVHKDSLGQLITVGDFVFGSGGSYIDPIIFEILEFVPQKAIVKKVFGKHYFSREDSRYLTDLIKVDPGLVTMHCLTKV